MTQDLFKTAFQALTGNPPLRWQGRLFDRFIDDKTELPSIIDLPTGLGKTMVMAIWLIARSVNQRLPRRLVYVVDRRTVVDQATDLAERLVTRPACKFIHDNYPLLPSISTLRGQFADNREWARDPSRPAIIIGTVDMIGSRLLFSGYRSSFKQRPLDAGLLGQDSLLVLDEAHLSKPFEKLIREICDSGTFQKDRDGKPCGTPMKVIRMSATSAGQDADRFKLEDSDLKSEVVDGQEKNLIVKRYTAKKRLTIKPAEKMKLNQELAKAAVELSKDNFRIVLFVRFPDDATKIADVIRKNINKKDNPDYVEVLTGTMRGLERDELLEKPVMKRFTDPDNRPTEGPAVLVSTSAGEVGFDLNADHLVCDAAPLDSMIQRLGRVNRRGDGDATIRLIPEVIKTTDKDGKAKKLTEFETALKTTVDLLTAASAGKPLDVSPKAIDDLKKSWTTEQIKTASTPEPTMVELTDILLDAWSMTSITEPMPGRPEVAPWLRGIVDEPPQTTIAWRAELDIPGFDELDIEDIEEWFDTHRILTHETLSVPTNAAKDWFLKRCDELDEATQRTVGERSIVIDRAGFRLAPIKNVIAELNRKNTDSIRNADLILPASFGGIGDIGLLDDKSPKHPDKDKLTADDYKNAVDANRAAPDVADARGRYRMVKTKTEDNEPTETAIGSGKKPKIESKCVKLVIDLPSDDDTRRQLISFIPKRERLDFGSKRQPLTEHVQLVRIYADEIIKHLGLLPDDTVRLALELAADWHDCGKDRDNWQRAVNRKPDEEPLGKSGGSMLRIPRGYRHEFGSLREFIDAQQGTIDPDTFDLAMHLIATHHGRGRPHFPKGGFDPDAEPCSPEIHIESIRRFARLQRKYGYWRLAWLENLLRCADAMASAEQETGEDEP